jgi:hypothetical protein
VRFHRLFAGALTALAVSLAARSAAAQPAGPAQPELAPFPDGSGSAPTPKNPSTGVYVSFADSAASLPQDDIRTAVTRELEHRPDDGSTVTGELNVSVEGDHIIVRFRGAQAYTERVLPLPEERAQIPVMLALLAGNLARDQRAAVRPEPAALAAPVAPKPPAPRVPPTPPYARHYLGLHLAQDFMFVGGQNLCDPMLNELNQSYACFYAGTSNPFFHTPNPSTDSVASTLAVATTRVLLSYDFALSARFTLGLRAGFAFRGGPPAGQNPNLPGSGVPFFPGHLEARASYWFVPLTNRPWGAFIGVGGGLAQLDAKVSHSVVDCETVPDAMPEDPDEASAYHICAAGTPVNGQTTTELDAWKKAGQGFVAVHGGAMLHLSEHIAATLDLNVLFMTPASGVAFEPAVGMVYAP